MKKYIFLTLGTLALSAGAQTTEKTYYFDFGGAGSPGSRGEITTETGWNNICPAGNADQSMAQFSSFSNLVDSDGNAAPDGMKLVLTTAWGVNGLSGGGGLLTPDPEQLGDLAVKTATSDYIFNTINNESGRSFVISGLDKEKGYRFTIFGSRNSSETRRGNYIFSGLNSWMTDMQVAGTGIGKNGENQNTGNTPVSDIIFPDAAGNITLWIENHAGTYVPLSCMKMEEISGATKPAQAGTASRTFFLDFGSDVNNRGMATTEAGWNNILANSGNDCSPGTVFSGLKDSNDQSTGLSLTVDTKFTTNGYSTGLGLPSPSADDLGDLAVETATYDYFFVDQSNAAGKMTFSGLDKTKAYRFHTFASRKATDARLGAYRFSGLNSWTGAMQAAGNALDNTNSQNMNVILVSEPIFPDSDGKIVLDMINGQKIYMPVNAMKIEEVAGIERPEVLVITDAELRGEGIAEGESGRFVKRGNNLYELYVKTAAGEYTITATDENDEEYPLAVTLTEGINRITVDFSTFTADVLPITYLCVEGSAVGGWNTTGQELAYKGAGVWNFKGDLKGYDTSNDSGRVNFVMNKSWSYQFKRVSGSTYQLVENEGDDIPLNPGTYDITVDLNNMTWEIANGLDELDANRVTVMGSSVANGQGASQDSDNTNMGYAYLFNQDLADRYENGLSEYPLFVSNISIGGNSSVNLLNRFDDLERDYGKWVVYGISLGNEGIHEASDREAVYNQWKTNMQTLISKARELGKEVVVMNNYTRGDFNAEDYSYVKKINDEIAAWDVPSVNLLGAIDSGTGLWADGYQNGTDVYHTNTEGHQEFFYAMVPSMMDALRSGKILTMQRTVGDGYELPANTAVEFTPDGTVHSFTLAFSAASATDETVAHIEIDGATTPLTIAFEGTNVTATLPDGTTMSVPATDGLNNIELSQNYARKAISLTVGESTDLKLNVAPIVPVSVKIGHVVFSEEGAQVAGALTLGEVMFYRSSMHTSSPFTADGSLNKSSLEVYVPVTAEPTNEAMSTLGVKMTKNTSLGVDFDAKTQEEAFKVFTTTPGSISVVSALEKRVRITDISGKTVADVMICGSRDFNNLAPGVYVVNNFKIIVK